MVLWMLVACGNGWIDQDPGCGKDVYSWSDDLLGYILAGDGSGSFDFDPVDTPRKRISGVYHVQKGNFQYDTTYAGQYWKSSSSTSGFGTVFHNGNLDLLYETVTTDRLGVEATESTRMERQGCEVQWSTWPGEMDDTNVSAFSREGRFKSAQKFVWSSELDGYDYSGVILSDLSSTFVVSAQDGSSSSSTDYASDGTSSTDFNAPCIDADHVCEGFTNVKYNGDYHQEYAVGQGGTKVADFTWDYTYEGDGTGSAVFYDTKEVRCEYTVTADGKCTYTCDDKSKGSCTSG